MYKSLKLVHINCNFNKLKKTFNVGDLIEGSITVQPIYKLEFKSINYSICRVIKQGSTVIKTTVVHTNSFKINSKIWKKGHKYNYPFQASINDFPSYEGQFFTVQWYLKVDIVFTNSVRQIPQKVKMLSNGVKRKIFPKTNMSKQFNFRINQRQGNYQVGRVKQDFENPMNLMSYLVIVVICALCIIFDVSSAIGLPFSIFEVLGCINVIAGVRHIIFGFGKFKDFSFEVLPNQTGQPYFPVKFISNHQWSSINSFSAYYIVDEKKDSQNNLEIKNIISSKRRIQKDVTSEETTLTIPFPSNPTIPPSFSESGCHINWTIVVRIHLKNGKSKDYDFVFPVKLQP